MRAYLRRAPAGARRRRYRPRPLTLWTVKDALQRLAALLGTLPDWTSLDRFLPDTSAAALERRAALASTLLAGLELARDGAVRLRQDQAFGPILVRRGSGEEGADRGRSPAAGRGAGVCLRRPVGARAWRSSCRRNMDAEAVIAALRDRYAGRGVELVEVGGGVHVPHRA